ncbi:MAG: Ig-like domain-containing protein [Candidatus Bathyarchaeota archaeon]|nr:Ig-like domain-containing protein [Candidatus Bathyarchaeota archaeon]
MTIANTDISFELRPSTIFKGEIVTVAGSINGVHCAVPMTVYFSKGDSSNPLTINATTDDNGGFTVKFVPDLVGEWSVAVSWAGDSTHKASNSQIQTLIVNELVTPTPIQPVQSMADLYFIPAVIGIIVAIAIVGVVLALLVTRKRP